MEHGIVANKKCVKKIEKIFEHPNGIFSIYYKDKEEVDWVEGRTELYNCIHMVETKA